VFLKDGGSCVTPSHVVRFAGIGQQVEKLLRPGAAVEADVFVSRGAEHAAFAGLAAVEELGDDEGAGEMLSGEGRAEADAALVRRGSDGGKIAEGGENVGEGGEGAAVDLALIDAGASDDERDLGGFLPEGRLLDPAVRAHAFAMIGGEDDEGVAVQLGVVEGLKDAADFAVDIFDEAVVAV